MVVAFYMNLVLPRFSTDYTTLYYMCFAWIVAQYSIYFVVLSESFPNQGHLL